jgi:glycosyltransferase involved in cell wall biosynthesis
VQPILFVLPGFRPCSAVSQALVAAHGFLAKGASVHVAGWGDANFLTNQLRAAGAEVHDLGRYRLFDAERLRCLYELTNSIRPTCTLVWGLPAVRLAGLLPRRLLGRLVAAKVLPISRAFLGRTSDAWLLRRTERIIVGGPSELDMALRLGLPAARVALIPPGVPNASDEKAAASPIPAGRYLLAVGPLERSKGLHDAIWSLEILKYLFDDLHLVIAGDGPDRQRLQDFVRAIDAEAAVHFLGVLPDLHALYAGAAAVWIPSHADRGAQVALEAMQAGRPIVASRRPRLAELVVDGETCFLAPPGDKVVWAKQTRKLLDDPSLGARLGQAGRRRVAELFSADAYVARLSELLQ